MKKQTKKKATKRNPTDGTMRNVRAANKHLREMWARIGQTEEIYERRLVVLETVVNSLLKRVKKLEAWADDSEHR